MNKRIPLILFALSFGLLVGCSNGGEREDLGEEEDIETPIEEPEEIETPEALEKPENIIEEILTYEGSEGNDYYIPEIHWMNNEEVLIKLSRSQGDTRNAYNKFYLVDMATKTGDILYEGKSENIAMDGRTLTYGENNTHYLYDTVQCLKFVDFELVKKYNLKETFDVVFGEGMYDKSSLNISKEGIGSIIYNGDIVTFDLEAIENYKVLIEQTDELVSEERIQELIEQGRIDGYREAPSTYYYSPQWSPSGEWMLYNERESTEKHESSVIMHNLETGQNQSFEFKYMNGYQWSNSDEYVISYAKPTHAPQPEIKVYNLNNGELRSYIFEEAIDGFDIQVINVLDTKGTKILLSCSQEGDSALLLLDFMTGEKEWLTEPSSKVYQGIISPNEDKIFYYGRGIGQEGSDLEVIAID